MLQITSKLYAFLLFLNNLPVCHLKVFIFMKQESELVTYAIFDILNEADWILFQASAENLCYMTTILLHILWKCKYWCIQKGLCDIMKSLGI